MTNRAIRNLSAFFVLLFAVLAVRQMYVQIVAAPQIAASAANPRHALLDAGRGRILASDGTVLAETVDGKRSYPLGPALAAPVGYVSIALRNERDRGELRPRVELAGLQRRSGRAARRARGGAARRANRRARCRRRHDDRAGGPGEALRAALEVSARGRRRARSAQRRGARDRERAELRSERFRRAVSGAAGRPGSPLLDRALDGLYPPGSTFKIFTAAAALESATVTMDSHFDDPGYLTIGDFTLHDNESEATGLRRLHDGVRAFEQRRLRPDRAEDGRRHVLRLSRPLGHRRVARFPAAGRARPRSGESRRSCPANSRRWDSGRARCSMTPLQMALIGATIANGGDEPRPYIVRAGHAAASP